MCCVYNYHVVGVGPEEINIDFMLGAKLLEDNIVHVNAITLRARCKALDQRLAITLYNDYRKGSEGGKAGKVTRVLNPDSVYLLHFWGTWCGPCLDIEEAVNKVEDTLRLVGCKTIHISAESKDRLEKWQKHVSGRPGEHLVALNVFPDRTSFVDEMAVTSFPTFMVVGRDHKILNRNIELEDAVQFIRSLQK